MFRRILVPLDGSRRAEVAIPAAARLAQATHGAVILMSSIVPLTPYGPYITTPSGPASTQSSRERDQLLSYLKRVGASEALAGLTVETRVTEGPAAESILTTSESENADLIAICARGATGFHRWKLGGVSQHVVRQSDRPVLLLPDPAPGAEPTTIPDQLASVHRVLVPLDGSLFAESALPAAIAFLAALAPQTGELHALQVISPFTAETLGLHQDFLLREANERLAQRIQPLGHGSTEYLHLSLTSSTALDADAAARIIAVAEPEDDHNDGPAPQGYDLIAMATHGRTGVLRWTLGSITERVIQTTRRPMLIVRPILSETSPSDVAE